MTLWNRWKKATLPNQLLVITGASVAFLTSFYVAAAFFQVWLLKQSGEQTDRQITRVIQNMNWLARSMDGSLKEAERARAASEKQSRDALDASDNALRLDQRAWVTPFQVCEESTEATNNNNISPDGCVEWNPKETSFTTNMAFKVLYKNYGKTFATHLYSWIATTHDLSQRHEPSQLKLGSALLGPAQVGNEPIGPITLGALALLGTNQIYIYGKVWYDDVFGQHHWVSFCYTHRGLETKNVFGFCPSGNDCDDCNQKKAHP